ncbi:MAG: translation initiation factor [Planctomycetota bacterium]
MTLKHIFKGTKWDVPCERCAQPLSLCQCPPPPPPPAPGPAKVEPSAQKVRVRIEKRQKGKKVTVLDGLTYADREKLLPQLKALCGAGGTIKEGKVEVQGEHKEKIVAELVKRGYDAKGG